MRRGIPSFRELAHLVGEASTAGGHCMGGARLGSSCALLLCTQPVTSQDGACGWGTALGMVASGHHCTLPCKARGLGQRACGPLPFPYAFYKGRVDGGVRALQSGAGHPQQAWLWQVLLQGTLSAPVWPLEASRSPLYSLSCTLTLHQPASIMPGEEAAAVEE
jgi:hypothetical protein